MVVVPQRRRYLSFPQSLNLSLFDLWFFFFCCCGGVGGGVLVVFVLCGGGFCVDSGGFTMDVGRFSDIKFVRKLRKWLKKMWKISKKIAFSECYQTLEIVFRTIFHCTPKHPDFNFFTGIHFPMHSFYTRNLIYIELDGPWIKKYYGNKTR